ncbi:MAG TPA: hypothetical protein VFQ68_29390 [Streptosporangiaceae bacterium]|nr:hypothetical protein [Streptosporangiaceae bacterium]
MTGGTAYSIFSSSHLIWPAVEPVEVAVLGVCAGVVMMTGRRGSGLRWLAAGVLVAAGIQTALFFAGLRFGLNGGRPGIAGTVGMIGGVMLVVAGLLGAADNIAGRGAAAAAAGGPMPSARARARMRAGAGIPSSAGPVLVIWACALPGFTFEGTPISYFSGFVIAGSFEPVGVAVLGACAGIVMMAASFGSALRWLAAGMLAASGTQTFLFFASWQFRPLAGPAYGLGSANVVGMIGGVMLAAAGVLGAAGNAAGLATAAGAADGVPGTPPPYVPGSGSDIPAGIGSVLRTHTAIGSAAAIGGAGFVSASLYQPASTTWSGVTTPAIQHPELLIAVALTGAALCAAGTMAFIRRSRFSRLLRQPGNPCRATVTASRPGSRALTLDAPCDGYPSQLGVRLAWGTESQIPPPGQGMMLYSRLGGIGPALLSASYPGGAYLGTGKRQVAFSAAGKTPGQVDKAAGPSAAPEGYADPDDI